MHMTDSSRAANLLSQLDHLNAQQLRRLLVEHLTKHKLDLHWEANAIERDAAFNADLVLPRLVEEWNHPKCYGKVLFLTKDQKRLRVVNDDGSLGEAVDWDDLMPVQERLRASRPAVQ
jgi:hypothetical protein